MTDVSVIGLGHMGAALARAFIDDGHSTCVWNRTASKAQALADLAAVVAPTAPAAIESSPVSVACVTTYDDLRALLEPVAPGGLGGRTIVNLITGTLAEAEAMQRLVTSRGGAYLDGHIPIYPRHIGRPETILMFCGPNELWEQHRAMLLALGGASLYFGEEIGNCNLIAAGVSSFFHVALTGLFESLASGLASQRSLDEILVLVEQRRVLMADVIEHSVRAIRSGNFKAEEASMAIHLGAMRSFRESLRSAGQPTVLLDDAIGYLEKACEAGLDDLELSALIKVMNREP
jgi:3-hydroxyisobutyrate dehydrogenase-like beta-hydroxyacid dehydrogenase